MIGRLTGNLILKQPPLLLLDVNGVGYEVFAPMTTFYQLPALNESTTLLTHLITREENQSLYGFYRENERELFRALIKVNGVGPKLALTILSGMETDAFIACIQAQDASRLVSIPGIGKKTAERLVIEMRDRVKNWTPALQTPAAHAQPPSVQDDAISALTALGYKPAQAERAIRSVYQDDATVEALIRSALQHIAA